MHLGPFVSESARSLVHQSLLEDDRVVVLGAGGWFGSTMLDLLIGSQTPVMAIASSSRTLRIGGQDVITEVWDESKVTAFGPTMVIDCAFLTRDRVSSLPLAAYASVNRELMDRMLRCVQMPTTRLALTISSGAAVHPKDAAAEPLEMNPYGFLKREAEALLSEAATGAGIRWAVARAWSVSGAYVRYPRNYALADMILDAEDGEIAIRARRPVWRRYCLTDDLLAVSVATANTGGMIIDSGGPLVEMSELAAAVRDVVNPAARISRALSADEEPDLYYTDDESWRAACDLVSFAPSGLTEQITLTARGLEASRP